MTLLLNNNYFISVGCCGRYTNEDDKRHLAEVNEIPPRFGFNYWFWLPRVGYRRKYGSVTIFHWLCFWLIYDNFNKKP